MPGFHYWPDARGVLGLEALADDARLSTPEAFADNSQALADAIAQVIAEEDLASSQKRLGTFRGQWAVVQDSLQVLDDPQVIANGYVQETVNSDGAPFKLVTAPVQFDETSTRPSRAPEFNEHGAHILQELLGLDWDSVVDMKVRGITA